MIHANLIHVVKFNFPILVTILWDQKHEREMAIILDQDIAKPVKGYWTLLDRVLILKMPGKPLKFHTIWIYSPKSTSSDEEKNLMKIYSKQTFKEGAKKMWLDPIGWA